VYLPPWDALKTEVFLQGPFCLLAQIHLQRVRNVQLDVVYDCGFLAAPEVELSVGGRPALSSGVLG